MSDIVVWHWAVFGALVAGLLWLDLAVFHRRAHAPSLKESAGWTFFWIALAIAFNGLVWWWRGTEQGIQFLTAYLVEKSLSMDNIFVFAVIFRFFQVPLKYQYRVLFWGILGAIVMRLAFILLGAELVHRFNWVLPVFGVFLVYTAVKLASSTETEVDPDANPLLRFARRHFRISHEEHGNRLFAREGGRWCATPLFLVLIVIESTDVMFAVDSVPAIFGITRDPFILLTSNAFAILGLRALYFVLAGVIDMFRYLHYGLSAVLAFVGLKMIAEYWIGQEGLHLVPPGASLGIILTLLAASIAASLAAKHREQRERIGRVQEPSPTDACRHKAAFAMTPAEPVGVLLEQNDDVSMGVRT
jgi:tellurite resistance protein TerC